MEVCSVAVPTTSSGAERPAGVQTPASAATPPRSPTNPGPASGGWHSHCAATVSSHRPVGSVTVKRQAIVVTIESDGQTSIAVEGVPGSQCEGVTKHLEESLGAVVERRRTGEYYQSSM